MPMNEYLLISRGQWDEGADKDAVQDTIDRFYAWYEQGLAQGRLKPGSRLANRGKLVSRTAVTDGPFSESKELLEVRPLEAVRSSVAIVTNETPQSWKDTAA